ncbi:MAG: hypothetical protein FGM41_01420 [Bacteroidetes bacterium]|nr:hypothetical protein [Bacteroidota bacterium]
MAKMIPFLFLLLHLIKVNAQVRETFDDGNFTANPVWQGTDSLFKVNAAKQLQSEGKSSLTIANLATSIESAEELEWEFWMRINFNPSSQNNCRFYLYADSLNLIRSSNASYIQFGGSTGNTDSISLYLIKNGFTQVLIKGRPGTLSKTQNQVKVKVIKTEKHQWQLEVDTSLTQQNWIREGTAFDSSNTIEGFMGINFKYTIGNAGNLFFDNLYQGMVRKDTIAPKLLSARWLNNSLLRLQFDEPIQTNLCQLSSPIFQTDSLYLLGNDLYVKINKEINSPASIEITLTACYDLVGNRSADTSIIITLFEPNLQDILITEILADPSPTVGLPDAEYIEIYNNSTYPVYLDQLQIQKGSKYYPFPLNEQQLLPKQFLVLHQIKDSSLFQTIHSRIGMSLPSLSNDGDTILLINKTGMLLHTINYNLSSYQDNFKKEGGYALEMIHPSQICKGNANWTASKSAFGGTPGEANSYWQDAPDNQGPKLLNTQLLDSLNLFIVFDEAITQLPICTQESVNCEVSIQEKVIQLKLPKALQHQQSAIINCIKIKDCIGNESNLNIPVYYAEQQAPTMHQLLINEICFDENLNSYYPKAEYIELYNNSKYAIELKNFSLSDVSATAILNSYLLLPDSFLILCSETNAASFTDLAPVLGVKGFPSLSSSDQLSLRNAQNLLLHQVNYEGTWLTQNLQKNPKAASIELVNKQYPCSGKQAWQPSLSPLGGSPGKINSVQHEKIDAAPPLLQLWCSKTMQELVLTFNEAIDSNFHQILWNGNKKKYKVNYHQTINRLQINLAEENLLDTIFTLEISNIKDCALNTMPSRIITIMPSEKAKESSIIINEVLYNSFPNQADFIELYNPGEVPINLDNLLLSRKVSLESNWTETISLWGEDYCLAPKQVLALHEQPEALMNTYPAHVKEAILAHPMLALPDEGGWLILCDSNLQTIDEMPFEDKMHFSLLHQTEGYSLSRLNSFEAGTRPENWVSTASQASPGLNQPSKMNSNGHDAFYSDPKSVSPNQDGFQDYIFFTLTNPSENLWTKLSIHNWEGLVVKEFEPSLLNAQNPSFRWDGINQKGEVTTAGLYQAVLKTQDEQGIRKVYRCSFAVFD